MDGQGSIGMILVLVLVDMTEALRPLANPLSLFFLSFLLSSPVIPPVSSSY
jgi:hypothetical protein